MSVRGEQKRMAKQAGKIGRVVLSIVLVLTLCPGMRNILVPTAFAETSIDGIDEDNTTQTVTQNIPAIVNKTAVGLAAVPGGPLKAPYNQPSGQDTSRVSLKDRGFTINLFDYDAADDSANQVNKPDNATRRQGINSADGTSLRPFQFFGGGTAGNGYNWYTDGTATPMMRILQNELVDGFPVLATKPAGQPITDDMKLDYLFNDDKTVRGKEAYYNVDGLFKQDEKGYYEYDSNKNYAYYDKNQGDGGSFYVHNDTYAKNNNDPYKIGFFPFDEWTSSSNTSVNPGQKNHHLGMSMHGTFVMPESTSKKVTYNGNQYPMLFEMGGDDDIWVFIDGVLVLDLGGIHQPVHGSINLTSGNVRIYGDPLNNRVVRTTPNATLKQANDTFGENLFSTMNSNITGPHSVDDNGATYKDLYSFDAPLSKAFELAGKTWNDAPGSGHTIDVFYLERGSYDSNLLLRMNFPLVKTTDLTVQKEWYNGNQKETNHAKGMYVQLYQQKKLVDDNTGEVRYTDPRPYGDPVKLEPSPSNPNVDFRYTYQNLPVHGDVDTDYYYYTVKEGYLGQNSEFIPITDGQLISNGHLYTQSKITYAYGNDGSRTEVYPDDENAAFHNGNNEVSVGTATVTNTRSGRITAQKKWLNVDGTEDTTAGKFNNDTVYAQLVKLTRASSATPWNKASQQPIEIVELNEDNNWFAGFKTEDLEDDNPNVMYIVREGTMVGGVFRPSEKIPAAHTMYQLESTEYTRTRMNVEEGKVSVAASMPDHPYNMKSIYWWVDEYTYDGDDAPTYWLNRTFAGSMTELQGPMKTVPVQYDDTFVQELQIPSNARYISDTGSGFDYVVDVQFDGGGRLDLDRISANVGTLTGSGGNYQLRVPAVWVKEHAGGTVSLTFNVSVPGNSQSLQDAVPMSNPATVTIKPTDYEITSATGYAYPETEEQADGIQLFTDGTGHAVLTNKPAVPAPLKIKKTDANAEDKTAGVSGAKFCVYEDDGDGVFETEEDAVYLNECTTGDDGTVQLNNVYIGTYWLVETGAPTGFLLRDQTKPICFTVNKDPNDSSKVVVELKSDTGVVEQLRATMQSPSGQNASYIISVPDLRTYLLPATGGPGMFPFLLVGSFLAALAAGGILSRRQPGVASSGERGERRRR